MKVAIAIRSLRTGGAERQAVQVAAGLAALGHEVALLHRTAEASPALLGLLEATPVHRLTGRSAWRELGRWRPDVLYGFSPGENVLAWVWARSHRPTKVVFGIRASNQDLGHYNPTGRATYGVESRLGRHADGVIANSHAGRDVAVARGMPAAAVRVVPNGIDVDAFAPSPGHRAAVREEWGVDEATALVGVVARLHPKKDVPTFLDAAAHLPDVGAHHLVVVGGGEPGYAAELRARATALGLDDRLTWAGERRDVARVYPALDLLCLPSAYGEGFPNVLGEAMASGVPCVTTSTGDSAAVVGDLGVVVPPSDPTALATGLREALARLSGDPGWPAAVRHRVVERFSTTATAEATAAVLAAVVGRAGGPGDQAAGTAPSDR